MPMFSVVMSAYNAADLIEVALKSVHDQTDDDYELILVDDGSTDQTPAIVDRYADRARVIHQENRGLGAAKNRGAEEATGTYLITLDADDLWVPWTLATVRHLIEVHDQPAIVFLGRRAFDGAPPSITPVEPASVTGTYRADFLSAPVGDVVGGGMCAIRLDLFREVGGYGGTWMNTEDIDLFLRMGIARGCVFAGTTPLLLVRQHDRQQTRKPEGTYKGHCALIDKERTGQYAGGSQRRPERLRRICMHIRGSAVMCIQQGRPDLALSLYRKSFWWQLRLGRLRFVVGLPWLALWTRRRD